jgi:hypothetical protein
METEQIEELALDHFLEGSNERRVEPFDIKKTREDFAIAWGLYSHLKNIEMMRLCTRLLASTGIDNEEVMRLREIGYETASTGINMADAAAEFFKLNPRSR